MAGLRGAVLARLPLGVRQALAGFRDGLLGRSADPAAAIARLRAAAELSAPEFSERLRQTLHELAERAPASGWVELGAAELQLGEIESALQAFDTARARDDAALDLITPVLVRFIGQPACGVSELEQIESFLGADRREPTSAVRLALLTRALRLGERGERLAAALTHKEPPFALIHAGREALAAGHEAEALALFAAAAPRLEEARLHFGQSLLDHLLKARDPDRFAARLREYLDADEDLLAPDLRKLLLLRAWEAEDAAAVAQLVRRAQRAHLLEFGNQALARGRHDDALLFYNEAVKRGPDDVLTRLQIGVTLYLANRHREAEANFAILRTLQAAERERFGVDRLDVTVLHETWTMAIGHIACLDTYIKAMELGWLPKQRSLLAMDVRKPPTGWRLLSYMSRYLEVVGVEGDAGPVIDRLIFGEEGAGLSEEAKARRRVALMQFFWALPDQEGRSRYYAAIGSEVQHAWQAAGRGPLLTPPQDQVAVFRMVMEQSFGLPRDAWYVLLHVRESGYHAGWEKHHRSARNARIADYDLCVEEILARGGWVVRAGDPSMSPIPARPGVIDYATSPLRSPELDILLCAQAKFFLGTNSGFSLVPPLFGVRCVLTNWSPLANPNWHPQDLMIPKRVLDRATGQPLDFEAQFGSLAGWSPFERDFQQHWRIEDNTPEELLEVVRQMFAELDEGWRPGPEAQARQQAYDEIALRHGGYRGSKLGVAFLERNAALLGPQQAARPTPQAASAA